jgi:hypothetical protein
MIEMTALNPGDSQGLDEAIGAYYEAVDRGEAPDPVVWRNRYPDLARELAEFFENQDCLGRVIVPLKEAVRGGNPARTEVGRLERNPAFRGIRTARPSAAATIKAARSAITLPRHRCAGWASSS